MFIPLLHFLSIFLIMLSLQCSYNINMVGIGKEYQGVVFLIFVTGICFFAMSL